MTCYNPFMQSNIWDKVKQDVCSSAKALTVVLCACYAIGLFAPSLTWYADLLSHFVFQYMAAALVLGTTLTAFRKWVFVFLCTVIFAASAFQIYSAALYTPSEKLLYEQPTFTIVQYNRNYRLDNHTNFQKWVADSHKDIDVIVLQEATPSLVESSNTLKHLYPHQIHEPRKNAFGFIILSKHPFESIDKISLPGPLFNNTAAHFTVTPTQMNKPISIYTVHALPPMGKERQKQRNSDLLQTAQMVSKDDSENIIMIGDWNITPYSPFFKAALKTSGLQKESSSFIPLPTWPAYTIPWLTQLPIDHILNSQSLRLIKERKGRAMQSDHYPIIATFIYTGQN